MYLYSITVLVTIHMWYKNLYLQSKLERRFDPSISRTIWNSNIILIVQLNSTSIYCMKQSVIIENKNMFTYAVKQACSSNFNIHKASEIICVKNSEDDVNVYSFKNLLWNTYSNDYCILYTKLSNYSFDKMVILVMKTSMYRECMVQLQMFWHTSKFVKSGRSQ